MPLVLPNKTMLRVGDEGAAVRVLQAALNSTMPRVPRLTVDGEFGPNTTARLMAFQKAHALEVDGVAGPQTWAALKAALAPKPPTAKPVVPVAPVAPKPAAPKPVKKFTSAGVRALKWARANKMYEHGGNNRGNTIDRLWKKYRDGKTDFIGAPWCGLEVWAAFLYGANIDLRDACAIAYTPAVTAAIRDRKKFTSKGKKYRLIPVSPDDVKAGDIVLFDWAGADGSSPLDDNAMQTDHIGLVTGPVRGGYTPTFEGNTQPGNGGDQSGHGGGDGTYERSRPNSTIICYGRVVSA